MLMQTFCPAEELRQRYAGRERRAVVSFYSDGEACHFSRKPMKRLAVRVRDISIDGITLMLDSVIARGMEIVIDLKTKPRGTCLTLLARVVHSTMRLDGAWIVDCDFITKPTEDQLQALL